MSDYHDAVKVLEPAPAKVRDRALEVLLGGDLEPIVDMVAWSPAPGTYEVASAEGSVRFRRERHEQGCAYAVESIESRNPIANQMTVSRSQKIDSRLIGKLD